MTKRILITASTWLHIKCFHLPYIDEFQKKGYQVDVACGGVYLEGVTAHKKTQLSLEKSLFSLRNWKTVGVLKREIKIGRYDMIICHTSLAAFFTRLAVCLIKDRPPVVYVVHGYLFGEKTNLLRKALLVGAEKLMAPVTTLLLPMNRWDEEFAKKHRLAKKIKKIPGMGVDFSSIKNTGAEAGRILREKLQISQDDFILLYAAEFSKRKNQIFLLKECKKLPENVKLLLPGEGTLRRECIARAKEMGIEERVVFPKWVSDIEIWYAAADAVITSSRSEGLPFHIMEAMGSGLPVIAAEIKGHIDLIRDGENGLLYPPGDGAACRKAIFRLMQDKRLREQLGDNARKTAMRYELDRVLPKVMRYYDQVLEKSE